VAARRRPPRVGLSAALVLVIDGALLLLGRQRAVIRDFIPHR
jgi:hypothetical protein